MAARNKATAVAFGSCQERKMIPTHGAPNRMGNELLTLQRSPTPGPGCYDSHVTVTPSPQKYQQDWSVSQMCSPGKTSVNSTTPRFTSKSATVNSNPGPGAYVLDGPCNQRVSWPMKFGSPDWSQVPMLERRALRTELPCDKEFLKHRNRVAYLRLHYS
ncbi:protein pitchfork isoform X2 [Pangasianodon hypophthalmus]|uniref:protein pitchfork isoform X2 n=1 Tax=Pangasianodon hypophthalmus TaxID=310915 RepID=UPI001479EA18|nr:protein pitchfork isoform X2 [Pangasianodon hypophthalmus]